jgi:bis(5'-nucleosidyl)-tetraphosphatase
MKETSAGAVIFRKEDGKIIYLLLQYGAGHWDFAKGHVEPGETEEQTMRREAEEETGITDLKIVPGFRETINYFYRRDGKPTPKDVIYLLAETREKEVKLSSEHVKFEWLSAEDSIKRITYSNSKTILKKANEFLKLGNNQKNLSQATS